MDTPIPKAPRRFKVDIVVKAMLRSFCAFIKGKYQKILQRHYYYWIKPSLRKHTQLFFQEQYHIEPTEYKLRENALLLLAHNTKTAKKIMMRCQLLLLYPREPRSPMAKMRSQVICMFSNPTYLFLMA